MFYSYIITNQRNGTLYTGHTDDLGTRMEQHKHKSFQGFAARYNCHRLVWFEEHETRHAAFRRERQIKNWRRQWKLDLIEKYNPNWLDISILSVWPLPAGVIFKEVCEKAVQDGLAGEKNPRNYIVVPKEVRSQ